MVSLIAALARAYRQEPDSVSNRLRKNYSMKQALGLEPPPSHNPPRGEPITYRGIPYLSHAALARAFGMSPMTFHKRYIVQKKPIEEALLLHKRKGTTSIPITIDGREFDSKTAAAMAYQISLSTLCYRLNKGLSPEEAVGINKTDH